MAKVLIIEDEGSLLSLYKELLESEGHTVFTASNGDAGLEHALNSDWEVMFLDIMLPGMDGISLLQKLFDENRLQNRKVYVLSNLDNPTIINECLRYGASAHYSKSELSPEHILEIVEKATAKL